MSLEFGMATWGNKHTTLSLLRVRDPMARARPTNEFVHTKPGPYVSDTFRWYRSDWATKAAAEDAPGLPWNKQPTEHMLKNAQKISDGTWSASMGRNMPEGRFTAAPRWSPPGIVTIVDRDGEYTGAWGSELLPQRPAAVAATMLGTKVPFTSAEQQLKHGLWNPQPAVPAERCKVRHTQRIEQLRIEAAFCVLRNTV